MTARKETTVKEAKEKADSVKDKKELERLILVEASKLASGEEHSIQQLLAYARKLAK